MRTTRRPSAVHRSIILLVLLAGCAQLRPAADEAVIRTRIVPASPELARERVADRLRRQGFTVSRSDGPVLSLHAGAAAPAPTWVRCPRVIAEDPVSARHRSSFQPAEGVRVGINARFAAVDGGTRVSLDPSFVGRYVNPYINTGFESGCASTGVLERNLLDAASD